MGGELRWDRGPGGETSSGKETRDLGDAGKGEEGAVLPSIEMDGDVEGVRGDLVAIISVREGDGRRQRCSGVWKGPSCFGTAAAAKAHGVSGGQLPSPGGVWPLAGTPAGPSTFV